MTALSPALPPLRLPARWRDMLLFNAFYFVAAADITAVSAGGGNLRLAWILLPLLAAFVPRSGDDRMALFAAAAFFGLHLVAAAASSEPAKGLVYSAWIPFNYYFFMRPGYALARRMGDGIWDAFIAGGRVQAILGAALFLAHVHERTRFIYYEPSYLAIGMVPYVFCTVFASRRRLVDGGLILLVLATNQSANMLIAVLVALAFGLVCSRRFKTAAALAAVVPVLAWGAYRWTLAHPDSPNYVLAAFLRDHPIDASFALEVLGRAGNRGPRIQAAWDTLHGHWLLGLGPGAYTSLTERTNFDYITGGVDFLDPAGLPVINVLLESTASAGVLATAVMLAFGIALATRIWRMPEASPRHIMLGTLLAVFVMLQIESGYLRAYLWFTFGAFVARSRPRAASPGPTP